jgi:integrase
VRFISVILGCAVKKHVLTYNPCVAVDYPKAQKMEHDIYTVEEVKRLLCLLKSECGNKPQFVVFFTLAAYMGARRGELMGLEWKDVSFTDNVISINRAYYYNQYEHTCFTDTPKTAGSRRSLKMPVHVMDTLREYKGWQDAQREICGGSWVESDRLFTKWNGFPMNPSAPYKHLETFCKRHDMRRVNIHSFRHFNASVLINSGVDVVTVQTALGHSMATTTLNIYSHAFSNAQTRAMDAIANALDL